MIDLVPVSSVEELSLLDPDGVLEGVYLASFPPSERVPFPAALTNRTLLVALADGVPAGFASVLPLRSLPVRLLEYLAVAPAHRSRGIGALLVRSLLSDLPPGVALVLEAERPTDPDPAQRVLQERRLGFYARLGAEVLPGSHRVPDLSDRSAPPLDLHLLRLGAPLLPWVRSGLSRAVLQDAYGL